MQIWISNCSRSRLKKCCSNWRFRQIPTGRNQHVDSLNRSAQRYLNLQFAMYVLAFQMVSSDQIGFVSLNLEHSSHFSTKSSICLLRPGHQTDCIAHSPHFVDSLVSFVGLSQYSSMATCRYSFSSDSCFALSGHPCMHNSWIFDMHLCVYVSGTHLGSSYLVGIGFPPLVLASTCLQLSSNFQAHVTCCTCMRISLILSR